MLFNDNLVPGRFSLTLEVGDEVDLMTHFMMVIFYEGRIFLVEIGHS